MSPQHTPGEWRFMADDAGPMNADDFREPGEVAAEYIGPGYYRQPRIESENGQMICGNGEYNVFHGATPAERAANVRLLIAAPKLRAALIDCAALMREKWGFTVTREGAALRAALAALEEADGKPSP